MNKIHEWINTVLIALVFISSLVGGNQSALGNSSTSFWNTNGGYRVDNSVVIDGSGVVTGVINPSSARTPVETIVADDTLVTADSGKMIYIGTAGVDLTLPTAASATGITYRVVVSANFATTNMTVTGPAADATDDTIFGALEVAGAVVACSAEDTISFVNTAELPGDFVDLHSDGTNWYITGQATTAGGITCTDAD